jgi:hypothetical protein
MVFAVGAIAARQQLPHRSFICTGGGDCELATGRCLCCAIDDAHQLGPARVAVVLSKPPLRGGQLQVM